MSTLFAVQNQQPLQPKPEDLRRILTQFTNDALLEKPEDILAYMEEWAASHIKRSPDGITAIETGGLVRLGNEVEALHALMHKRAGYYQDIADGCQYHYMMALEDSEGDIFQLQHLDQRVLRAKQAGRDAQEEQTNVDHQLEYYMTTLESEEEKSNKVHQIYRRYYPAWSQDILISPRSRIKLLEVK